jgi:hypothetical protein
MGIAAGYGLDDEASIRTVFGSDLGFFFTEKMSKNLDVDEPA